MIDIVQLAPELHPAASAGPVAGVVLVEGEAVEMLDPFWLFAHAQTATPVAEARPLCLLAEPDDRWSREILRPLLEAAGYRVGFAGDATSEDAAVVIASRADPGTGNAPVIRLRPELSSTNPDEASVYRYDRVGLLAAIERQLTKRSA